MVVMWMKMEIVSFYETSKYFFMRDIHSYLGKKRMDRSSGMNGKQNLKVTYLLLRIIFSIQYKVRVPSTYTGSTKFSKSYTHMKNSLIARTSNLLNSVHLQPTSMLKECKVVRKFFSTSTHFSFHMLLFLDVHVCPWLIRDCSREYPVIPPWFLRDYS